MSATTAKKPGGWFLAGLICAGLWLAAIGGGAQPARKVVALAPDGSPKLRAIERECHVTRERMRSHETVAELRAFLRGRLAACEAVWLIGEDGDVSGILEHEWQIPVLPR
jgi:hypothetical protein